MKTRNLFIVFLIFYTCLETQAGGEFQSTKIGGVVLNFTGTDKLSFADGSPGYGVELSLDRGGDFLRYFFKTKYLTSTGSQNFIKSGVTYFSGYELTVVQPELGLSFFPIPRKDKGLNIYVWGTLGFSYNSLLLKSVPSTVNVSRKDTQYGSGYGAGLGFEYLLFTSAENKKILIYSELGFQEARAPLAGQSSFEVKGMSFSLGFGF